MEGERNLEETMPAIKIMGLNRKNQISGEYPLGDVLLLDKWERDLSARGFKREEIEELSPSYYGTI